MHSTPQRPFLQNNISSFYGSSCANNGEDALNTPVEALDKVAEVADLLSLRFERKEGKPPAYASSGTMGSMAAAKAKLRAASEVKVSTLGHFRSLWAPWPTGSRREPPQSTAVDHGPRKTDYRVK
eukprot:1194503-Prorocentrum_minimum.AAC.7